MSYATKVHFANEGNRLEVAPGGEIVPEGASAPPVIEDATGTAAQTKETVNQILAALRGVGIVGGGNG